jgi:hypothetical protein
MKLYLFAAVAAMSLVACDTDVNVPPAEKNTTIVNPPAEKKETTIVNPPAEKKTETTTTTETKR